MVIGKVSHGAVGQLRAARAGRVSADDMRKAGRAGWISQGFAVDFNELVPSGPVCHLLSGHTWLFLRETMTGNILSVLGACGWIGVKLSSPPFQHLGVGPHFTCFSES